MSIDDDPSGSPHTAPPPNGAVSASHMEANSSWIVWAIVAAFGTYFCMYAFRKPFTAGSFASTEAGGQSFKTILVISQVMGYMLSKFIGIKIISEMRPERRALSIFALVCLAEVALVAFGFVPRPWNALCMFLNGLPLGMVFGLVLGFLEGRRLTEALAAGLCASFIVADGFTKSVGAWLLNSGVPEHWMPATAGALFILPLGMFAWMLSRTPAPDRVDMAARNERHRMSGEDRMGLFRRHAIPISLLSLMYLLVTILRSFRADFAPEIWTALGARTLPSVFTYSEIIVAAGVMAMSASFVLVHDNRWAFFASLAACACGFFLVALALLGNSLTNVLSPFAFMVMVGLGLYMPYVAVHTTVFERLLAMTKDKGNVGFLMYVVDSVGYLGYVAVMLTKTSLEWFSRDATVSAAASAQEYLRLFIAVCIISCIASWLAIYFCWRHYAARTFDETCMAPEVGVVT